MRHDLELLEANFGKTDPYLLPQLTKLAAEARDPRTKLEIEKRRLAIMETTGLDDRSRADCLASIGRLAKLAEAIPALRQALKIRGRLLHRVVGAEDLGAAIADASKLAGLLGPAEGRSLAEAVAEARSGNAAKLLDAIAPRRATTRRTRRTTLFRRPAACRT